MALAPVSLRKVQGLLRAQSSSSPEMMLLTTASGSQAAISSRPNNRVLQRCQVELLCLPGSRGSSGGLGALHGPWLWRVSLRDPCSCSPSPALSLIHMTVALGTARGWVLCAGCPRRSRCLDGEDKWWLGRGKQFPCSADPEGAAECRDGATERLKSLL